MIRSLTRLFIRRRTMRTDVAARTLAKEGARQQRERVRAKCDEMRKAMGMAPANWGKP